MPKLLIILLASLGTFVVLVTVSALVSRLFVMRAKRRLVRSVGREPLPHFSAELVRNLPSAVKRYLSYALQEGQPNIRYAELQQRARFRHRPGSPWFTVKATEILSGMEPGFVWDAQLRHNAAWWRTAKLSYTHGRGHGHLKLFGAITLQEYEGSETDVSMLFRFLSELVWLPTGLLPTKTLRWEHIDDDTARATIIDDDVRVEAVFHVDGEGKIDRIVTDHKYRDHKSGFEQARFSMICREYRSIDGVNVPTEVDFVWNLESGDFEYGQFILEDVHYVYE